MSHEDAEPRDVSRFDVGERREIETRPGGERPDFAAEGLLDGLDERSREARLRLLESLHDDGVALDELARATRDDRLALLPVERLLSPRETHSVEDVARASGFAPETIVALRQALGLPAPEPGSTPFSDADVESYHRLAHFKAVGVSEEDIVEMTRVLGTGLARFAEAMRSALGAALIRPGDTEYDLGRRYAAITEAMMPEVPPALANVFRLQMREIVRHDVITQEARASGRLADEERVAVAFSDIVGFTSLGEQIPTTDLGRLSSRLTRLASEAATGDVRLVKTIGDAVLLVAHDPVAMLETTLRLGEQAESDEDMPRLRTGVAFGPAVARWGDWYGSTVNMASRVCGRARPGSVLVTQAVHAAAEEAGFPVRFSFTGHHRIKGVSDRVELWRARRADVRD